ncbi:MAG: hypothetical protein Mars2KO_00880 [Maribacter sp.]
MCDMLELKFSARFVIVFLLLLHGIMIGQNNGGERYHGIEIGSETRTLTSEINGKHYKMYISLPEGYAENTTKKYPVFYVMDGQWHFIQVYSGYSGINYDGFLPEIIIVGLTYGGETPDYATLRSSDFTPTRIKRFPESGGAKKFMEVLRNEIIPFVDKEYRTNGVDRALGGSSLGGLITHYALFNTPDLFNGYVICNASLLYDSGIPFQYEEAFSKEKSEINASVFMVSGEYDNVPMFEKMVTQIKSRKYRGLHLESRILEDMGHGGATNEAFARGLLSIYKIRGISLEEEFLEEYTGNYEYAKGRYSTVLIQDGQLVLKRSPLAPPSKLYPLGNDKFSFMGNYRDFHFVRDEDGQISGYTAEYAKGKYVRLKKMTN